MKKYILLILFTTININCYSQVNFEKGYYINNLNEKVECLIKNLDWRNNPTEFEYRLTEGSNKKIATIRTIKEFGIYNISKYIRRKVDIDRSSNKLSEISDLKNAIFNEEMLFLQVLIEGKANLYSYENNELKRYFFNKDDSEIKQLIFKEYLNSDDNVVANNRYKQQLWANLNCSTFKMSDVENIGYTKNELIKFFIKYNNCNNEESTNFEVKQKKDLFNLSIRPGVNISSLSINNNLTDNRDTDFGSKSGLRVGIEAEIIMPFNKNKWSIFIEPTFRNFESESASTTQNVKVNYKSIEIPIGLRHYFFLNEKSKIFVNGAFIIDLNGDSVIDFEFGEDLEISSKINLAFGLGYKYNDRVSLEMRYQTSREILNTYNSWYSDYNSVSVIFGYSIF